MATSAFKDHFSGHAESYAAARPSYPPALFEWLAAQAPQQMLAWDVGCGSGQAACALAAHFGHVVASDPSAAQIAAAAPHPRVEYRIEPAEVPSLEPASVDLIVVAQALHWFDQARFHAAAARVLRPRGVFAAWSYGLTQVDAAVDAVFMHLYDEVLGPYWPAERSDVENGYRDLPFPYTPIEAPNFVVEHEWPLRKYLDYLRSWSATQRYMTSQGSDPVSAIEERFAAAWGEPHTPRRVIWPLALRVGWA
jgi:SAM-dependent methyltransferase